MSRGAAAAIRVSLETGSRLTFASALDWPGWSRSGRGDEAVMEALRAYAPRYAPVARGAALEPPDPARIEVVARAAARAAITTALQQAAAAAPPAGPAKAKRWPQRYAARRIGWHVLDHAWEIEDRSV